jgi:hypothetical protein
MLPAAAGKTGTCHNTQLFSTERESTNFVPRQVSAPQVARIIGMNHWHLDYNYIISDVK